MPSIEELERIAGDPARPYDERVDAAEKIVMEIYEHSVAKEPDVDVRGLAVRKNPPR
jgi:hypothetical protein